MFCLVEKFYGYSKFIFFVYVFRVMYCVWLILDVLLIFERRRGWLNCMFVLIKMMLLFCLLIIRLVYFFFVWDIEFDKFKNNVLVLGDLVKYFNLLIIFIISFEIGFNGLLVLELKV